MPDHMWVSDYQEHLTDPDIGHELDDATFAHYHALAWWRPDDLMAAAERGQQGGIMSLSILYAGLRYEEGDLVKGLWWIGWAGPVARLQQHITDVDPRGRFQSFPVRRRFALDLARRLVPGIIPKDPTNIVAWSVLIRG